MIHENIRMISFLYSCFTDIVLKELFSGGLFEGTMVTIVRIQKKLVSTLFSVSQCYQHCAHWYLQSINVVLLHRVALCGCNSVKMRHAPFINVLVCIKSIGLMNELI